jgi:hypothetical protein
MDIAKFKEAYEHAANSHQYKPVCEALHEFFRIVPSNDDVAALHSILKSEHSTLRQMVYFMRRELRKYDQGKKGIGNVRPITSAYLQILEAAWEQVKKR